jgi:hypothetical protein
MTWGLLRALGGALAIAAVIAVVASQSGKSGGSALDPVAQAADTTATAGTAEFGLSGSVSAAGQTVPISGNGAVDMRTSAMRMKMSMNHPPVGEMQVEEILSGTTVYMHFPEQLTARMPGGKPWMKVDIAEFTGGRLPQGNQQNPADLLQALKAVGSSKVVGSENIGGVATTHYSVEIDLDKVAEQLGDSQASASVKSMFNQAGVDKLPMEVWIDRAGRVRRESVDLKTPQVTMSMTIAFTDFGVPVDTTPPPADQVMDASGLLKLGSGG